MIGDTYTLSPTVAERVPFRLQLVLQHVRTRAGIRARCGVGARHSWRVDRARRIAGAFRPIGVTGYSGFGDSTEGPYTNRNKVFEFTDNLSWIRGRHSFKVGGNIRLDHYNQVGNQFSRGAFTFDGRATGSLTGAATSGGAAVRGFPAGLHAHLRIGGRAGDDGLPRPRASPTTSPTRGVMRDNMTLDLGVRYEYVPPWFDKGGTLMNAYLPYHDTGAPVADLVAPSHPRSHRRRRFLRGFTDPVRAQHPDVARWRAGRAPRQ